MDVMEAVAAGDASPESRTASTTSSTVPSPEPVLALEGVGNSNMLLPANERQVEARERHLRRGHQHHGEGEEREAERGCRQRLHVGSVSGDTDQEVPETGQKVQAATACSNGPVRGGLPSPLARSRKPHRRPEVPAPASWPRHGRSSPHGGPPLLVMTSMAPC